MSTLWLPEGGHHGLNIIHKPLEDAGGFTGGGWKLVPHTTESPRDRVFQMWQVLRDKRAAPHFVIGTDPDYRYPVVIQCIALNRAGRALEHPAGTPETNRANAIQIEMCGYTRECHTWEHNWLAAQANLWRMVKQAQPGIRLWNPRTFQPPVHRCSGTEWVDAHGVYGHCHAANNTHTDPEGLRARVICLMARDKFQTIQPWR